MLGPGHHSPGADGAVQRVAVRIAAEACAECLAEPGHGLVVQREFSRGQQFYPLNLGPGALRVRGETAQRIDPVIQPLDAQRRVLTGREYIHNPAAHGIFAGFLHLRH